jgi:hypothetical protein
MGRPLRATSADVVYHRLGESWFLTPFSPHNISQPFDAIDEFTVLMNSSF